MSRMHRPGDEKRSLVLLADDEVRDWLACPDTDVARSFLRHYPAEAMKAWPAPQPARRAPAAAPAAPAAPVNGELF